MHTPTQWYLDCCPSIYNKIEWSYQEVLEKAVEYELWLMLQEEKDLDSKQNKQWESDKM